VRPGGIVGDEMQERRNANSHRLPITSQRLGSAGQEYAAAFHSDLHGPRLCVSLPDTILDRYGRKVILEPADGRPQAHVGERMKRAVWPVPAPPSEPPAPASMPGLGLMVPRWQHEVATGGIPRPPTRPWDRHAVTVLSPPKGRRPMPLLWLSSTNWPRPESMPTAAQQRDKKRNLWKHP